MSTVGIAGAGSTIAKEFVKLLPNGEKVQERRLIGLGLDYHRYLICTGFLAGKPAALISDQESEETWNLNYFRIIQFLDALFATNDHARVCVIGSHSGIEGSYDTAYAGAKAAMHLYIERKELRGRDQMIVGLAPHIIRDSAMTERRKDLEAIDIRGEKNRLRRWLTAKEVAVEVYHLLYESSTSLSGQIIRMRP